MCRFGFFCCCWRQCRWWLRCETGRQRPPLPRRRRRRAALQLRRRRQQRGRRWFCCRNGDVNSSPTTSATTRPSPSSSFSPSPRCFALHRHLLPSITPPLSSPPINQLAADSPPPMPPPRCRPQALRLLSFLPSPSSSSSPTPPPPPLSLLFFFFLADPGTAPQVGDRVSYVIVKGSKGQPQYERAEDPLYVLDRNLSIDTEHYLEGLKGPLTRIFEGVMDNPESLFGASLMSFPASLQCNGSPHCNTH